MRGRSTTRILPICGPGRIFSAWDHVWVMQPTPTICPTCSKPGSSRRSRRKLARFRHSGDCRLVRWQFRRQLRACQVAGSGSQFSGTALLEVVQDLLHGTPHLASVWLAAASAKTVQALQQSVFCRKSTGYCRAVLESTGKCSAFVRR
jgi:hypothetical protein